MPSCFGPDSALDFTDATPMDRCWIAVLLIAGYFAGAATDALCHIEVKAVLFSGARQTVRDKTLVLWNIVEFGDGHAHKTILCSDSLM
jgi:hypothetical protein